MKNYLDNAQKIKEILLENLGNHAYDLCFKVDPHGVIEVYLASKDRPWEDEEIVHLSLQPMQYDYFLQEEFGKNLVELVEQGGKDLEWFLDDYLIDAITDFVDLHAKMKFYR